MLILPGPDQRCVDDRTTPRPGVGTRQWFVEISSISG
jgi:hypothetical protein